MIAGNSKTDGNDSITIIPSENSFLIHTYHTRNILLKQAQIQPSFSNMLAQSFKFFRVLR